jgi:hypothetical protein
MFGDVTTPELSIIGFTVELELSESESRNAASMLGDHV